MTTDILETLSEQETTQIEAIARYFVGEDGLREAQSLMYGDSREVEISYGVTVEKDGYGLTLTDRGGETYYAHAPALFEYLDRDMNPEKYIPLTEEEQARAHAERFISTYVGGSWADPRAIAEMLIKGEGEHKNQYSTWTVEDGKLTWANVHGQSDTVSVGHAHQAMVWPYGALLKEAEAKFAPEQEMSVDARLQQGETINYYTYDGPKSDLMAFDGGKQSWKKGVSFDHPDEGSDEDRFSREIEPTEPFSPDQLVAYLAAEGEGATFEDQNGTIHSLENGKLKSETVEQTVDRLEQIAAPTDTTLSADKFAAVMSAWPNGREQLGYIAETALDGKENKHFDQVTALEGDQIVMREGNATLRTDATEYVAFMEREHPDLMKQAQAEVTAREEAEFERQQEREAGKANVSAEIDAVISEIAVEGEAPAEKSLYQMIDAGEERPAHVSEDDWKAAQRAYSDQMTRENTPEWYINGGSPEDERFYDAMANGPRYESREEIVTALRALEAEGQKNPEIIQGWNTYTLKGDEVHKQNHESHPDRGGEWEVFDANDTERTIDSHWMEDARQDEYRDKSYAEMATNERKEVVGRLQSGDYFEGLGATRQGYHLDGDILTLDNEDGSWTSWHVDDLATEIEPTAEIVGMDGKTMTADEIATVQADKADADNLMQLAEEIEQGFPSLDPMFDDLNSLEDAKRKSGMGYQSGEKSADHWTDNETVVDFKAMADRARSAAKGGDQARALETEQGA